MAKRSAISARNKARIFKDQESILKETRGAYSKIEPRRSGHRTQDETLALVPWFRQMHLSAEIAQPCTHDQAKTFETRLDHKSGDTTPCKVTPVILHGVVSPLRSSYTGFYPQNKCGAPVPSSASRIISSVSVMKGLGASELTWLRVEGSKFRVEGVLGLRV